MYFYARPLSLGDTVILIRNATVLPHACPRRSVGTVNTIGLMLKRRFTDVLQLRQSLFNVELCNSMHTLYFI